MFDSTLRMICSRLIGLRFLVDPLGFPVFCSGVSMPLPISICSFRSKHWFIVCAIAWCTDGGAYLISSPVM